MDPRETAFETRILQTLPSSRSLASQTCAALMCTVCPLTAILWQLGPSSVELGPVYTTCIASRAEEAYLPNLSEASTLNNLSTSD